MKINLVPCTQCRQSTKGREREKIKASKEREREKDVRLVLILGQTFLDDHNHGLMYARCRFCVDSTTGIPEPVLINIWQCLLLAASPCELPVLFREENGATPRLWA